MNNWFEKMFITHEYVTMTSVSEERTPHHGFLSYPLICTVLNLGGAPSTRVAQARVQILACFIFLSPLRTRVTPLWINEPVESDEFPRMPSRVPHLFYGGGYAALKCLGPCYGALMEGMEDLIYCPPRAQVESKP